VHNVLDAGKDEIVGRGQGHGYFGGEPGEHVGDVLGLGVKHPDGVALIGIKGRSYIPSIGSMGGPSGLNGWFLMDKDMDARWGNWGVIEVVVTIELGPSR
jgi:hypothetical protein